MRVSKLLPVVVASLSFACSEAAQDPTVTAPDSPLFAKPVSNGTCTSQLNRTIKTQMADLFARPQLDAAQALWGVVESQCGSSTIAQARESMLEYVQFTITNKGSIIQPSGTWQGNLISHWASTFAYVGYTGADQPGAVPVTIFDAEGSAGVIPATLVGSQELAAANAALTLTQQNAGTGDPRGHLFVIYPLPASCLGATNLANAGPCYEFGSFPQVAPAFDPMIMVGICQTHDDPEPNTPALAHLTGNVARIQNVTSSYPTFCSPAASIPAGSWNGGIRGIASRLAWHAQQAILPKPLYAVHGGLGGLGGKLSPHQAVDLLVFDADFEDDVVGQQPGQPEIGSFTTPYFISAPGSILVQSSLGNNASQTAVLSQGGGNCQRCGGLLLEGILSTDAPGVYATNGVYNAEWVSLQNGPTMKAAPFVLRSSSDAEIARVTYSTKSSAQIITFGNSNIVIANWVRGAQQHFRIRVDLDAQTTTLYIDNVQKATGTFSAANFAKIAADFRGIDSGTMGWDNIKVQRIAGT